MAVKGAAQVHAMFQRKGAAVIAAAKDAAKIGGQEVAQTAQYLAPRDQFELINSIRVEDASTRTTSRGTTDFIGVVVKAGDETTIVTNERGQRFQNAKLQENGTKNMPANPYFNPAWRALRSRVRARITRAISKAWTSQ